MNKAAKETLLSITRKFSIASIYIVLISMLGWFGTTRAMAIVFAGLGFIAAALHLRLLESPSRPVPSQTETPD